MFPDKGTLNINKYYMYCMNDLVLYFVENFTYDINGCGFFEYMIQTFMVGPWML